MSTKIVDHMFDKYSYDFEREDVQLINDFISGKQTKDYSKIGWAFDVVNNK